MINDPAKARVMEATQGAGMLHLAYIGVTAGLFDAAYAFELLEQIDDGREAIVTGRKR